MGAELRDMSSFDNLQKDGLQAELILQQSLRTLREALQQQLEETERKHTEELEKRIEKNAFLCTDEGQSSDDKDRGRTKSKSISNTISLKQTKTVSPAVLFSSDKKKHGSGRTQCCDRFLSLKSTQQSKEEEAEAECQKKFCALPVPDHSSQQLYRDMIELREKGRKQGREQRIQFLVSMQKPFSFQQTVKEKREKGVARVQEDSDDRKNITPKKTKGSSEAKLKDQLDKAPCRPVPTSAAEQKLTDRSKPKVRTADRTRKEKLGFLDEKPSFSPKITQKVPDFNRLHKTLQRDAQMKPKRVEGTMCQPFLLRTSALPPRKRTKSPEDAQGPQRSLIYRSKSHGELTSLSADTLPTFITDAVRKRALAIRKSVELRDSKNQQSTLWLRKYQMRTESIRSTVALRAKLLDPHSSLKEVHEKKLQHHRDADQQRMREYTRELQEIQARVSVRPYLFEQVKQKCAKARAEQIYQSKLRQNGLKETYVKETGQAFISEQEGGVTDPESEQDTQSRAESQHDGEKIEDVEERSVKSKEEDMP